ncbi:MAG TPA: UDP-glucuronic acid decarboxylase family protein [Candidatus Paceibacterota bacterium]
MSKIQKTVLVTGGAGFVGSHLCDFLLAKQFKVICLDNLLTGSKNNIAHISKNKNFKFIKADIVKSIPVKEKIDWVFNLACPASPVWYQKDPIGTIKANTIGIINVLEFAKKNKARILQASTSEIYGDPLEHPQKETYRGNVNTLGPRACYDEGKRVAESLFMDYHRQYGLDIKIIRIFNTYGPRMDSADGRVVSNFIVQALSGKPITIYGEGSQTRSFQYVTDLIEGIYKMMEKENLIGPVNLGNPKEFTIKALAEIVLAKTKSKSLLVYKPLPTDDPIKRKPDISLAKEKLIWEPKISLDSGLNETIEYFKNINR